MMHPNREGVGGINELDADKDVTLVDVHAEVKMDANIQVVTTAAPITIDAQVPKASAPMRERGVVIQDPKETAATSVTVHTEDEAFARQLEAELNANTNWNEVIEQRIDEEAEELKRHLQIVVNDDDDVYTEATPLASKVPFVDYQIHHENNKPYYKMIRADETHKLFLSFITLLKNFDREDLETLWKLVKERFESTEPKNFSDDFLLNTFKIMFEKHDMILLVEKKYPLTHFTLEQMLNNVRLEVKEESKMSLELLRLIITDVSYTLMLFGLTKDAVYLMLLDRKKVIITEDSIRQALRLDDADVMINAQVDDLSFHNTKYTSLVLTQKVFANMRRIGKGFLGVETPLFDAMLVQQQVQDVAEVNVEDEDDNERVRKLEKKRRTTHSGLKRLRKVGTTQRVESLIDTVVDDQEDASKQGGGGGINELDADKDVTLVDVHAEVKMDANIQDTDEAEPAEVEEVLEVVTAAKLMTEVVTTAAPITIDAQVPKASAPRRRRGVVIQDPEETATTSVTVHTEAEELKRHLQIVVNDDDDDVYTEATPLASKVPFVDYQIHHENNKPYYKMIKADETYKLFLSFITLLKNFDREDLETLWKLVKERFESTEPKNFSDDFLLNTFKIMFEKHDMILLVEKKYPLTHFTLEQMLNNVRLEVKEESKMSLELLRSVKVKGLTETEYQLAHLFTKALPKECFEYLVHRIAKKNVEKVEEHLIAEEIEKLVEGMENVGEDKADNFIRNSPNDPDTRSDPESYKGSLEVEKTAKVQPVNTIEVEEESSEDDYELRRMEKGNNVEETRNTPSPTTIRSLRILSTLISSDTKKL
nr:hypothetical protein [Tanacetum cinerariifolium]